MGTGEMIYPRSADVNATKLEPSTRRQLSLVGAASEQPKGSGSGSPAACFSQCQDKGQTEIKTQRGVRQGDGLN